MTARFADVLEISLAMSVVLAVLLALRPLLKKRLRAGAFYWVWLLAALRLCIPFNLSLPQAPVTVEAVPGPSTGWTRLTAIPETITMRP